MLFEIPLARGLINTKLRRGDRVLAGFACPLFGGPRIV